MARLGTYDFEGVPVGADATPANTTATLVVGTPPVGTATDPSGESRGLQFTTGATAATSFLQLSSTFLGTRSKLGMTFYLRLDDLPPNLFYFGNLNLGGAGTASIRVNTDGKIAIRNGNLAVHTSTFALVPGTDYRIEWLVDATGQSQQFKIFALHSATPLYDSGAATYTSGTFDTFAFGVPVAAANVSYKLGWVAVDDATFPGPRVTVAAPTVGAGADQNNLEPFTTVTLTATASTGSVNWSQVAGPAVVLAGSGLTRTFKTPGTLAGTTLTFRATSTVDSSVFDDVSVTVLQANEFGCVGNGWVALELQAV